MKTVPVLKRVDHLIIEVKHGVVYIFYNRHVDYTRAVVLIEGQRAEVTVEAPRVDACTMEVNRLEPT